MYLHDNLHICLLAIQHRYPHHTIDLNPRIITMPGIKDEDWTAEELITFFSKNAADLLQTSAHLNIDPCSCELYLPLRSTTEPAFFIHCRGKIPVHHPGGERGEIAPVSPPPEEEPRPLKRSVAF